MKIAIISPNKTHLQEMGKVLEARSHTVVLAEGGKSRMRQLVEQEHPDLLLVDGMCCDPNELSLVEHVTMHHPRTAVVLLCATHTPEFLLNGYEVFPQQLENLFCRRYRQGAQSCNRPAPSVGPVVGERQLNAKIPPPQGCDDGLQVVAIFAGYPHSIALNARLHLLF